jgi:hypothetical protein
MRYLTTPVVVFIAAVTQGALAADLRVGEAISSGA